MSGRFFAAPIFLALIGLSQLRAPIISWRPISLAVLIICGALWPTAPIRSGAQYGTGGEEKRWESGIADERAGYYQRTGLLAQVNEIEPPNHKWAALGRKLKSEKQEFYRGAGIGLIAFFAGPETFVLDNHALCDPFLSRLPVENPKSWRVGHYFRDVPPGYLETLRTDSNQLKDPNLHKYYDKLRILTRDPLLSFSRINTLIRFNLGAYQPLIVAYRNTPQSIAYDTFNNAKPQGTTYNAKGCQILNENGLLVTFDSTNFSARIEISVDHNDDYFFKFYNKGDSLATTAVNNRFILERGLRVDTLSVPSQAQSAGFDAILITARGGDEKYSIGHLRIIE